MFEIWFSHTGWLMRVYARDVEQRRRIHAIFCRNLNWVNVIPRAHTLCPVFKQRNWSPGDVASRIATVSSGRVNFSCGRADERIIHGQSLAVRMFANMMMVLGRNCVGQIM